MQVTVVGCSGSYPGPESPASCYLIEHEGTRVVLDLGNGALGPLARYTDLADIDAVIISHLHADHCIDLTGMYVARNYHPDGPLSALPVYGPAGTAERIWRAYAAAGAERGASNPSVLAFHDLTPDFRVGALNITAEPMVHPVAAFGFRVSAATAVRGGRPCVTYSGDTGPHPGLARLAEQCDLALFEASFLSGETNAANLHLTAEQAAQAASAAGAGRLVLTHLVPWNDQQQTLAQAQPHFSGDLMLARSGLVCNLD